MKRKKKTTKKKKKGNDTKQNIFGAKRKGRWLRDLIKDLVEAATKHFVRITLEIDDRNKKHVWTWTPL